MAEKTKLTKQSLLKDLPAVHEILEFPGLLRAQRKRTLPRWALRQAAQGVVDSQRRQILEGVRHAADAPEKMEALILEKAKRLASGNLCPVINATGVILHTNLGRAPLAKEALDAIQNVAKGYSNLEFDLAKGDRGIRYSHVEGLLCGMTGAEAALVVNNNAAAVFLALRVLANDREVVVSRGELVEIGGSFRIPEILMESGAQLMEVGTTNRTHLKDYEKAIRSNTGLLLKVHPSNYHVIGFHKEVTLEELVAVGRRFSLPVMQDLGSGCLLEPGSVVGLQGEPTVGGTVKTGVDVVSFSGDKLLGGPQAGILLGKRQVLQKIQSHPLNRVLRIDKLTLAALEATLLLYRDFYLAQENIPTLAMLSTKPETLRRKAQNLARSLRELLPSCFTLNVRPSVGRTGGGSLPLEAIPGISVYVKSSSHTAQEMLSGLRRAAMPVIARIEKGEVVLDVRTLRQGETTLLCSAFKDFLSGESATISQQG